MNLMLNGGDLSFLYRKFLTKNYNLVHFSKVPQSKMQRVVEQNLKYILLSFNKYENWSSSVFLTNKYLLQIIEKDGILFSVNV